MIGRTRHFTVKDGNGKFTTVSIGVESDDSAGASLADAVAKELERHFHAIAAMEEIEVMHSWTCGHRQAAASN